MLLHFLLLLTFTPKHSNSQIILSNKYEVSEWSMCSVSCGEGIQHRKIKCLDLKTNRNISLKNCQGTPPKSYKKCRIDDCSKTSLKLLDEDSTKVDSLYGDDPSLLGSNQKSMWVPHFVGDCSASCGRGVRFRNFTCIRDYGNGSISLQPEDDCPAKPPQTEPCEIQPCYPEWVAEPWSQCSVSCGVGIQTRNVYCIQKISQSITVDRDAAECIKLHEDNELRIQTCFESPCNTDYTRIFSEKEIFQFSKIKNIYLNTGDNATVLIGATLKLNCPLSGDNVEWYVDEDRINGENVSKISLSYENIRKSRFIVSCVKKGRKKQAFVHFQSINAADKEMHKLKENLLDANLNFQASVTHNLDSSGLHTSGSVTREQMTETIEKNDLKLQYFVSDWSQCSVVCGAGGSKSREILCGVFLSDSIVYIDLSVCTKKLLKMPIESEDCELEECPTWHAEDWSQCYEDRCVRLHTSLKTRKVTCVNKDFEKVDKKLCSSTLKPPTSERCFEPHCQPKWIVSAWSQCKLFHGPVGIQKATFKCVIGDKNKILVRKIHCKNLVKKKTKRYCLITNKSISVCEDVSDFCDTIPLLNMCTYPQFLQECCLSCYLSNYFIT